MKTFPIHLSNGATVCTPDNHAMKARVRRTKMLLRTNSNAHKIYLEQCSQRAFYRTKTKHSIIDGLLGVSVSLSIVAAYLISL